MAQAATFARNALALAIAALIAAPAAATVRHVTSCLDDADDPATLRGVIATVAQSGDTIELQDLQALPLACSTITLATGANSIVIAQHDLAIRNSGGAPLTIDASAADIGACEVDPAEIVLAAGFDGCAPLG